MPEYVWTRCLIREEDEPPGEGWQYAGGCIRGTREDYNASIWRLTRWVKEGGQTERFQVTIKSRSRAMSLLGKPEKIFSVPKKIGTDPAYVTPPVTVTQGVTPPAPTVKPKGMAWALQLLRT